MRSLYCEAVGVDHEFHDLLRAIGTGRETDYCIVRDCPARTPEWGHTTNTSINNFCWADDFILVRSSAGIECTIAANGSTITYYHDGSASPAIVSTVVDELCPLVRDVRGDFCLHGALMVSPFVRGFILLGDAGTGKSTAAMIAALQPGWSAGCDDSVVVAGVGENVIAKPSYPGIRLRKESIELFRTAEFAPEWKDLPIFRSGEKRRVLPQHCRDARNMFHEAPVEVAAIVELRPSSSASAVTVRPAARGEMVTRLIRSAFKVPILGHDAEVRRFEQAAGLVNEVDTLVATYPKTPESIVELLGALGAR